MTPLAPPHVPQQVLSALARLWDSGHAAYLVGGGVRDELLGTTVEDWDAATDARPERIQELFPGARYENRFGTVTIGAGDAEVQLTTFRRDHRYGDHRRPETVTFTDSLQEDLLRRDFTVNAIAWGRQGGSRDHAPAWVDPTDGLADLQAHVLRAVGDAATRFDEDGLRLIRAARFAAQLGFEIEPRTRAAMTECAATVKWVSNERIGDEVRRMLAAHPPSRGFEVLADTGVLEHALPELAAQHGVPQDKAPGMDLWRHCLATLDAAAEMEPRNERLKLAALLHDIGKPATFADGRFIGHDVESARMAAALLTRLAFGRRDTEAVVGLVRNHMFSYETRWSSAAVRRFIRRVGLSQVDDLLNLRAADNVGSGLPRDAGRLDELRTRISAEIASGAPLALGDLAVNGDDLVGELGLTQGPQIGAVLDGLLGAVLADPSQNTRERLLELAREAAQQFHEPARR